MIKDLDTSLTRAKEKQDKARRRIKKKFDDAVAKADAGFKKNMEDLEAQGKSQQEAYEVARQQQINELNQAKNNKKVWMDNHNKKVEAEQAQLEVAQNELNCAQERKEALEKEEKLLKDYPPQPYQLEDTFTSGFNICVTGPSRAGKSTFVNTIRGLRKGDPGAAYVVTGKEGTKEPQHYVLSSAETQMNHDLKIWDCPGHSTPNFPLETYLRDMGLRYYNAVIVFTTNCFSQGDLKLMNEMVRHKVPFMMVRNKIDDAVESAIDDGDDVEETLEGIREDLRRQGVETAYLISTRICATEKWDFPKLMKAISEVLVRDIQVERYSIDPAPEDVAEN